MANIFAINNKLVMINNSFIGSYVPPTPPPDPWNPLNLPDNTIRCKFASGYTPNMGTTQTLIDAEENIWDIYYQYNDWYLLLAKTNLVSVLGANTSNVTIMGRLFMECSQLSSVAVFDTRNITDMSGMFESCSSLTSAPLFNTSNVTNMGSMFYACSSLTSAPLLDTSKVTDTSYMLYYCDNLTSVPLYNMPYVTNTTSMFARCVNVQSGALALYNQIANQGIATHSNMFYNCGSDTITGRAELAQIPSSWGGTGT